ncbi:hypothetical protein EG339_21180 [Chryseobacterium bernardetii]|uniref:Uncharacterized protein n=2 Tax=Chryseobacterium bernardetii TaxID=1241978 RepID=A0A3G6TG05_9FLAO|nr:hypothetical protein EG339_21180 [Chryseobacterium bernardetii]
MENNMDMANEERLLPMISLVPGSDFYVDALNYRLIDTQDRNNIISGRNINHCGRELHFHFDEETRNVGELSCGNKDQYKEIHLQQLEIYDREGSRLLWAYVGQMHPRVKAIEVEIAEIKFLYEFQNICFREKENPFNLLTRQDLHLDINNDQLGFYIDRKLRCPPLCKDLRDHKNGQQNPDLIFVDTVKIGRSIELVRNEKWVASQRLRAQSRKLRNRR